MGDGSTDVLHALTRSIIKLEDRIRELEGTVAELMRRSMSPRLSSASRAFVYGFDLHKDIGVIAPRRRKLCSSPTPVSDRVCATTAATSPLCAVEEETK